MTARHRFGLLAPVGEVAAPQFRSSPKNDELYLLLLHGLQKLRANVYREDGAITSASVDNQGRFRMKDDEGCWHLLLLDPGQSVIGCVRMRLYSSAAKFEDLCVSRSALARSFDFGIRLRRAVERDLTEARREGCAFVEIGGWALDPAWRNISAARDILAACYALGQILGGSIGLATATSRHHSASILRKVGGTAASIDGNEFPPYYDPQYGCHMELLRFTSSPSERLLEMIVPIREALRNVPVVTKTRTPHISARLRSGKEVLEMA